MVGLFFYRILRSWITWWSNFVSFVASRQVEESARASLNPIPSPYLRKRSQTEPVTEEGGQEDLEPEKQSTREGPTMKIKF